MFKSLIFFIRFFLLWLLFIAINGVIFILKFNQNTSETTYIKTITTFYKTLQLVFPINTYLAMVPLLFLIFCIWIYAPHRYKIPMLFYGDVLKNEYQGKKIDDIGSQQDLAWNNVLGFINNKHQITFDNIGKKKLHNYKPEQIKTTNYNLNLGKPYLQPVYQQFINL
jgi:hypothetical protein